MNEKMERANKKQNEKKRRAQSERKSVKRKENEAILRENRIVLNGVRVREGYCCGWEHAVFTKQIFQQQKL